MVKENVLVVFEGKKIRRIWFKEDWWFSVIDVVETLTDSPTPRQYWGKIKDREFIQLKLSPIWIQLKLQSSDKKYYNTDCANTKNMLRIIQSIPSKKAEPFKQWLAKVGYERIQEIENPELAQDRAKEYYEIKGYSKSWIEKRLRGIAIRQELTDEWKTRGANQKTDYAILTNEISKATFGKTIKEYKTFKGLAKKNQNLRDHMNDLELIFNMLGEKATTEITKTRNSKGLTKLKSSAKRGGEIASNAKKELETETNQQITTKENYLHLNKNKKLKTKKKITPKSM